MCSLKGNRAAERKFGASEKLVRHWQKTEANSDCNEENKEK